MACMAAAGAGVLHLSISGVLASVGIADPARSAASGAVAASISLARNTRWGGHAVRLMDKPMSPQARS
eukprot:2796490-Pleurochrysis_carterae.AAC.1